MQGPKTTRRYCFYPRERLTVEPTKTVVELAWCKCPPHPFWRTGAKTEREGREWAKATHASPPPLKRRGLRRAKALFCHDGFVWPKRRHPATIHRDDLPSDQRLVPISPWFSSFSEPLRPPMKQCSGADKVWVLLQGDAARRLGVFQLLDTGEMAIDQRRIGERPQMLSGLEFRRIRRAGRASGHGLAPADAGCCASPRDPTRARSAWSDWHAQRWRRRRVRLQRGAR